MTRMARSVGALLAVATALAIGSAPSTAATPRDPFRATVIARADRPIAWAVHPDGTAYVAEQGGTVRAVTASGLRNVALDLRGQVSDGTEQGLLGIAFSPDGTRLYTDRTDPSGDTRIEEHPFAAGRADRSRTRLLLAIDQPYGNHNGGQLVVTSDGVLWIGMGDGGSAGDPQGHAQDPQSLLGKILRIDPARPGGGRPYAIPTGNLPAGSGRPEIWALGVRNPWRFTVDEPTGTVWIGDVGQDTWEEVDAVPIDAVGTNLGWNRREGMHPFGRGGDADGTVDPVWEYRHRDGRCSITGGVVVRDPRLPSLRGRFLVADWCTGELWSLQRIGGTGIGAKTSTTVQRLRTRVGHPVGFGVAAHGAVIVLSGDGPLVRLTPR